MKEYIGKKETEIFNVILDELGDRDYVKFKSQKKGYMALNVDNLGNLTLDGEVHKLISMSHNRKQNGDLMADPDMQFAISQQGVVIPITFQNDFTGSYDIAIIDGNQINERKAEKLAEFTNIWLNNLNAQQGILEHKYSLVDVEGNAIDSKFKQNFAFLDDDTFPQELEIQKISITNDVKKVAKGDDYPEYFANFTQGEKGLFNFGVFAAQNGISPTTVAKFLKATSGRGSKSNKEGIAEAIDSLVKEINLISSKDIEKEFKRRTGFTPDEGKKLLEYENINELLQAHIWENTFMREENKIIQLQSDEKLLNVFLEYYKDKKVTADTAQKFLELYHYLEPIALTLHKFNELDKTYSVNIPKIGDEYYEFVRIPKSKDGEYLYDYTKEKAFMQIVKVRAYEKGLWSDNEVLSVEINQKIRDEIDKDLSKETKDLIAKKITDELQEKFDAHQADCRRAIEEFYGITPPPFTHYGRNYAEWYHDGIGAINKLNAEQKGVVAGAFYRDDLGDITLSYYALKKVKDIEPKDLKDLIENGKVIDVKVADYTGNITLTLQKDDFAIILHKNMDENHPTHDYDFQSITKIQKQENTMPSADYTKRQNETNGGAYSRTKNNYNANYGNYGARQNHAQQEQGGFNQTSQNTATQTANAPQGAEQGGYKSRQQYASKSYKSPKSEKTEQPKTTEKPNLYELAKQSNLQVDESIERLQRQLKDPKTKEAATAALMNYLAQFNDLHNYSARNVRLCQIQARERGMESISHLGSFESWKELKGTQKDDDGNLKNVSVLKGEKGLSILVPVFKPRFLEQRDIDKNAKNPFALVLDENGQKIPVMTKTKNEKGEMVEVQKQELAYFSLGKVFDISQTNAFEIGAAKKNYKVVEGDFNGQITEFTLKNIADKITKEYGIEVSFVPLRSSKMGYNRKDNFGKNEIFVDSKLSEAGQMATLFHELGHAIMHKFGGSESKELKEVQAETFAYIISRKFGLETSSAEYISSYLSNASGADEFFKMVEPVRKSVAKAYEKLDLQGEFDKLVAGKEAYEENAKFKEEAEAERIAQGKLYSFETNFGIINPDDDSAMNEIREKAKQEQAKEQEKDSHNSHNKQRDKNRP